MLLGKRIKSLRKQYNLTQEELGKKISVTKVSISCYENETRTPTLDTLVELSKIFNVDINYFLGNDQFIIKDEDTKYGVYMSNEEVAFIEEIRKNNSLYHKVVEDPKRMVELINKRIN